MTDKLNLEDKLKRLKEIQTVLESKPPLTESMKLLEEAFVLKNAIEKELQEMENRLVDLSKANEI
jgi:exonuclease VII small subunit